MLVNSGIMRGIGPQNEVSEVVAHNSLVWPNPQWQQIK